jgi:hypothetical protein
MSFIGSSLRSIVSRSRWFAQHEGGGRGGAPAGLQLIAEAPHGIADATLRAPRFSPHLVVGLVGASFAEAKPRAMKAAGMTFRRFVIPSAGRRAIG